MTEVPVTWPAWTEEALTAEMRALLACARAVVDPGKTAALPEALAVCPDGDRLCEAAVAHGMLGHLQRLAAADETGTLDASLVRRLGGLQRQSAQRCLRQTARLLRILETLREGGVRAMPFKGPVWAERLYGDVTLRSWADLDLLVVHEQVLPARAALLAEGFEDVGRFTARMARKERGVWGQIALSNVESGVHVELHWEVTVGLSARSLRPEGVFERAGVVGLLGREVLTPSPADMMLITCLDGARDRWDSVERMLGLAVQVDRTEPAVWPEVLAAARAAGCARRVVTGVAHVCRVFGLPIPPDVEAALAGDAMARALLGTLKPESLQRDGSHRAGRHLQLLFWRSATEDTVALGLWNGATRFFTPGPEDWEGLRLPPRMAWLYYPLRPLRLAVKWAGRPFRTERV